MAVRVGAVNAAVVQADAAAGAGWGGSSYPGAGHDIAAQPTSGAVATRLLAGGGAMLEIA